MAYISSFVYCDSITQQMTPQGPKLQLNNPLQVLAPIAIPGNFSFSVVCNIAGLDSDPHNVFRLEFVSPSGQIVFDSGKMSLTMNADPVQNENHSNLQIAVDLRNLIIKEMGLHEMRAFFNDDLIGEYKIDVIKGESDG